MRRLLLLPLLFAAQTAMADPFDTCPAKAFLTQGKVSQTFSINLVTGDYRSLAPDMGTKSSVNGLGFNPNDRFIYGWGYEYGLPVRVHSDFQVEPMNVTNIANSNFYVGDVSTVDNKYYVYRKGASYGLYSIGLDPDAEDYNKMVKVVDGATISLSIADFAFHPDNGLAYAVDSKGVVHEIDATNGSSRVIGNAGITGSFGAAYFDVNGNLYLGRNQDGSIFRIDINSGEYTADLFAIGPSASINDGSRCALAPVVDAEDTNIDFGDAPDSYGTYFDSNGARHGLTDSPTLFLGDQVDGESDSAAFPLSDDETDGIDDDDGIQFASNLIEANEAVVIVKSSGTGYLSAWIDLDLNGEFDVTDQIITDKKVSEGKTAVYFTMPVGVTDGETWARFRLSSSTGLQPTGGVSDGEVEDYQVKVVAQGEVINYYPSEKEFTTLAFEDNWPHQGDFDMNDLVVYLKTAVHSKPAGVTKVSIKGEVAAVGAAFHNGFAIRLPGVKRDQVDSDNLIFKINNQDVDTYSPLEWGRDEAILMVSYNLWDFVGTGELCKFYRTEEGCGSAIQMNFTMEVPMLDPVDTKLSGAFDPFLFATPGAWHGGHFVTAPGRSYEIHLKNQAPTEAFDVALFDMEGDDVSDPANGRYFLTKNGMPYALEIGSRWDYPIEYRDISHAYWLFSKYATSGGLQNSHWFDPESTNRSLIFKD